MPLVISGKNFKLTSGLKAYVEKHVDRLTKFSPSPVKEVRVELDHDHNQQTGLVYRAEISLMLTDKTIKAGEKAEHMEEVINLCIPKIISQLEKFKSKKMEKRKPGSESIRIS